MIAIIPWPSVAKPSEGPLNGILADRLAVRPSSSDLAVGLNAPVA
jgi:hypothetical protein